MVVAAVLLPLLLSVQRNIGMPPENGMLSALGMLAFALGWIGDTYTTDRVMKLKPAFDRRGVDFPIPEQNRFLPQYPSLREQLISWVSVFSVVYLALAFYAPVVAGGCALVVQGGQTLTNVRIWKRVKLALVYLEGAREYSPHHRAAAA
jgi:hypothetical protein